jgi:hypothetical protein
MQVEAYVCESKKLFVVVTDTYIHCYTPVKYLSKLSNKLQLLLETDPCAVAAFLKPFRKVEKEKFIFRILSLLPNLMQDK